MQVRVAPRRPTHVGAGDRMAGAGAQVQAEGVRGDVAECRGLGRDTAVTDRTPIRCPRCGAYVYKAKIEAEALADCPERDYAAEDREAAERAACERDRGDA
jgi:hypothetical protein